ncbi:transposase [Nonomuraea sp. NPDC049750]|uniref:transposase n=1 Tax=Nonomuraea sp. NPDC049750 TaxID=3154738 RepID=UPI00340FE9D2
MTAGDRKDGTATAFVARQYLGRVGKTDNGIVTVTAVWADERGLLPGVRRALHPGRAVAPRQERPSLSHQMVAGRRSGRARGRERLRLPGDCGYGDIDAFRAALETAGLPFVLGVRATHGRWGRADDPPTPRDAARALTWGGPENPGDWRPVRRRFRDGRTRTWWAAEATLDAWGPDAPTRLVIATTDPATLPDVSTWYLVTNLPRPGGPHDAAQGGHGPRR